MDIDFSPVVRAMDQCPKKVIQRYAKAVLKKTDFAKKPPRRKFSFKSVNDAKDLYKLAGYLYAFEEYSLCYDVCAIYDHVIFNGDYTLWAFIEPLRHMQISILIREGKIDKAEAMLSVLKQQELPLENQMNDWAFKYKNAMDFEHHYQEAKEGMRIPSVVRYLIMNMGISCLAYIQMGYLPEKHEMMKDWMERIFAFLRSEEK